MGVFGLLEHPGEGALGPRAGGRTPAENLERWLGLQGLNGGGPPQQIIRDSVEATVIEAHESKWTFDPKDDKQATAARALNAAIAEARQRRTPGELAETLAEVRQADSFAE